MLNSLLEDKRIVVILASVIIAIVIGSLFAVSYGAYFDTTTASIPFGVSNGINIGDYFSAPSTSLSLTPVSTQGTNAPAITGCKVTNIVNLVATDGTSYTLSNTSPQFSPTFAQQSIVQNPYNNKVLSSVNVNVNLYCDPSTLTQYGYYPFLQNGIVNVSLQGRTPSGQLMIIYTGSQPVNTVGVNGQTVTIATFSVPISQIQYVLPSPSSSYYSQQNVVTTGTLNFKQGAQSYQQIATHVISPLYTSFSLLISPNPQPVNAKTPTPAIVYPSTSNPTTPTQQTQCPSSTVLIGNTCINLIQNISLAGGKTSYAIPSQNYIIYSVVVNDWQSGQPYPTIKLTNLDTQTSNIYTLSPNSRSSGYPIIASSGTALIMTDILNFNTDLNGQTGRYQIQLMSSPLGIYNRPSVAQDFVIYNSQPTNYASTTGTCPIGQYASQTANGLVCLPNNTITPPTYVPAPTNAPVAQPVNSPVALPTQQSNNVCVTLSSNSGMCVPVANNLGNNVVINAFQQLLLYFHAYG